MTPVTVCYQGGARFNFLIYSYLVYSSGSQPRGRAPPKGHQINLMGRKMVYGEPGRKHTFIFSFIFDFSRQIANLTSLEENCLSGGADSSEPSGTGREITTAVT